MTRSPLATVDKGSKFTKINTRIREVFDKIAQLGKAFPGAVHVIDRQSVAHTDGLKRELGRVMVEENGTRACTAKQWVLQNT